MADDGILSDELLRELMAVGEVDILVGVTTWNNAATIEQVLQAVQTALVRYFPRQRTLLIAADAGSRDETPRLVAAAGTAESPVVMAEALRTLPQIVVPYHGAPGRGAALRTVFAAAELARAKACAVVGGDAGGLTPEWIERLVRPVLRDGYDFVAPLYRRPPLDGLLVRNLLYPVTRAVYGVRVREPLSDEYGVSARLAGHLIGHPVWSTELGTVGIDLWLTAAAATGDYRMCEAVLGPRLPAARAESPAVTDIVRQVVGSLFACLELHEAWWTAEHPGREVPVLGGEEPADPESSAVPWQPMLDRFRSGVTDLAGVLGELLAPDTLAAVTALAARSGGPVEFPDTLWARTVYDLAASYHHAAMRRSHLLQAVTPLYLGRAGAFVAAHQDRPAAEVDRAVEALGAAFAGERGYLLERWKDGGAKP